MPGSRARRASARHAVGASKAVATPTECAILGLLADGEQSGYDLLKRVGQSVGIFWQTARTQLYNLLPRLVQQGWATVRHVEQRGRPDKQLYRITPSGRRALRAGLEAPFPGVDKDFLQLKTFLGAHMRHEKLVEELERNREDQRRHLAWLEAVEAEIDRDESFYGYLTLLYGLEYTRGRIRWCDRALELLAERKA